MLSRRFDKYALIVMQAPLNKVISRSIHQIIQNGAKKRVHEPLKVTFPYRQYGSPRLVSRRIYTLPSTKLKKKTIESS